MLHIAQVFSTYKQFQEQTVLPVQPSVMFLLACSLPASRVVAGLTWIGLTDVVPGLTWGERKFFLFGR